MCGGFFLKFSNREVNSEDRTTLTHNVLQITEVKITTYEMDRY